jgi:hypothetical protein
MARTKEAIPPTLSQCVGALLVAWSMTAAAGVRAQGAGEVVVQIVNSNALSARRSTRHKI